MLRSRLSRSFGPVTLSVVSLFAVAIPLWAQNYGLGDQVLTLGAAAFRPRNSTIVYTLGGGATYLYGPSGGLFLAPLVLPDGAEIFQICLYADVPGVSDSVVSQLSWTKLAPGGFPKKEGFLSGSILTDNIAIGPGVVCTDPGFSYVFHDDADVDGDLISEHVAHFMEVLTNGSGGLGGLRIAWRRQISPPPGGGTFADVSTLDAAWPYIEALYASGITAGCQAPLAPPRYCPDATLTRRQMAVFLAKALGLHWAN